MGNKRIGFVTTSFPRYLNDAAGAFVYGLARQLARSGHGIEVVVPEPPGENDWDGSPKWLEGIKVSSVAYARPRALQRLFWGDGVMDNLRQNNWLAGAIPFAIGALMLTAARHARAWDVVISHWLVPSALVAGMVRRNRTRHLAIAHSADVHLLGRLPLGAWMAKAVCLSADHLGFVSRGLRDEFINRLPADLTRSVEQRSSVISMGIDLNALRTERSSGEIREELGIERFGVLFLGRLVPIKGVDLLIDAMGGLDGFTLIVAGDGSLRESLEKRAHKRGIDARFLGWVGPRVKGELLAACDALVLPSRVLPSGRHEGMPVTLVEALGLGCPVIASKTGSIPELVENDVSSIIVPPDNVSALTDALIRLQSDPSLRARIARNGRECVEDRDWSIAVKAVENVIR